MCSSPLQCQGFPVVEERTDIDLYWNLEKERKWKPRQIKFMHLLITIFMVRWSWTLSNFESALHWHYNLMSLKSVTLFEHQSLPSPAWYSHECKPTTICILVRHFCPFPIAHQCNWNRWYFSGFVHVMLVLRVTNNNCTNRRVFNLI